MSFDIEYAEPHEPWVCAHGHRNQNLTRFVSKDNAAVAVVYLALKEDDPERFLSIAVSLGEWGGDGPIPESRRCFTIWHRSLSDSWGFMVREPEENHWQKAEILGRKLSATEARNDPEIAKVWEILDQIYVEDPVVLQYLKDGKLSSKDTR